MGAGPRPDQFKIQLFRPPKHIFIEILIAIQTYRSQRQVIHAAFDQIKVPCPGFYGKHPVIPQNISQCPAGFIIGSDVWQLILVSECLVNFLILCKIPVWRDPIIQGSAPTGKIQLFFRHIVPDLIQHRLQGFVPRFQIKVRHPGI